MITELSQKINRKKIENFMQNNFGEFAQSWMKHQTEYVASTFLEYGDHDKFLICIHLMNKTLDFYNQNNIQLTMNELFEKKQIEIHQYNVIEISKVLNIPKETTRRKIVELEKLGAIKRIKKKIILDQSVLKSIKPVNSTKRTAVMLSYISSLLKKYHVINFSINSEVMLEFLYSNFTKTWLLYYGLQIPIMINWKNYFNGDLAMWHIWACTSSNKTFTRNFAFKKKFVSLKKYPKEMEKVEKDIGLSAMTISNITHIPRATVIRKLKKLMKSKHLIIDKNKHYHMGVYKTDEVSKVFEKNMSVACDFLYNFFNLIIFSKSKMNFLKNKLK